MEFIFYFPSERQIVQVTKEDVKLDDFESFTMHEWSEIESDRQLFFPVVYDGIVFNGCLLQVVEEQINTDETISRLRRYISEKHLHKTESLLKLVPRARQGSSRARMIPLSVS